MPSSLYQQYQPGGSLMDQYQQFKMNPMGALSQRFNIPQNISNPNDILQYLLNTRQISQQQVNSAMQMRSMFN